MELQRGKGENSMRILCVTLIKIFENLNNVEGLQNLKKKNGSENEQNT